MLCRTRRLLSQSNFCRLLSASTNIKPEPLVIDPSKNLRNPLEYPDYFHVHNTFTIKDLFDARVHYGHKEGSLNNKMKPFLFGSRLGHTIFDLDLTSFHLREALNFLAHVAYNDGIVLFISRNSQFTLHVENTAKECSEFAYTRKWRLGVFTNSTRVFKCTMRLPDVCIFLNTLEETGIQHEGVVDAAKLNIPTIGIVDSNCDPNLISYPVPGNDDSFESLKIYCKVFKEAILRGKKARQIVLGDSSNDDKKDNGHKADD